MTSILLTIVPTIATFLIASLPANTTPKRCHADIDF
jgi:hypothetical protein